jgi:hypothetical protein
MMAVMAHNKLSALLMILPLSLSISLLGRWLVAMQCMLKSESKSRKVIACITFTLKQAKVEEEDKTQRANSFSLPLRHSIEQNSRNNMACNIFYLASSSSRMLHV